jgi:hypothetical protein
MADILDIHDESPEEAQRDEADLARFGYKQELRRSLGVFSSFAVAFTYTRFSAWSSSRSCWPPSTTTSRAP